MLAKRESQASARRALMARIGTRHTAPELALRAVLWRRGLRYRLHWRIGRTRPDIVFPKQHIAIFIDGCFWHGCPEHYVKPRSRPEFWAAKLRSNTARDRTQTLSLEKLDWTVLRFWEHSIAIDLGNVVEKIVAAVSSQGRIPKQHPAWIVTRVDALTPDGKLERWLLEDLRDPLLERIEERTRSTKKW